MTWNYRVIEFDNDNSPYGQHRAIHEVFYEGDDPVAFDMQPAVILWELWEGEKAPFEALEMMRAALEQPILKASDFLDEIIPEDRI